MGQDTMRVKIKKSFMHPRTGKMLKVDHEMNAPMNIFWIRRLKAEDCVKVQKQKAAPKKAAAKEEKGSK